jgi:hypothetical protein
MRLLSHPGLLALISLFALKLTLVLSVFLLALSTFLSLSYEALLIFFLGEALSLFFQGSRPVGPATLAVVSFLLLAELAIILFLLFAVETESNARAGLAVLACNYTSSGHGGPANESGVSHEAALGLGRA